MIISISDQEMLDIYDKISSIPNKSNTSLFSYMWILDPLYKKLIKEFDHMVGSGKYNIRQAFSITVESSFELADMINYHFCQPIIPYRLFTDYCMEYRTKRFKNKKRFLSVWTCIRTDYPSSFYEVKGCKDYMKTKGVVIDNG